MSEWRSTAGLLRYFAERAKVCWEGSDADDAVEVLLAAADLLEKPESAAAAPSPEQ